MANGSQNKYFESMFGEIAYLRRILDTLGPSSYRPNCDWSEVVREQEAVLNTLRGDFAVKMTDLEQRLKRNTVRIFGLKEAPGEVTESVVLKYFQKTLKVWVTDSDIDCCHRAGTVTRSKIRPVVVKFTNDEARKKVWRKKQKVQDSVLIVEELCYERLDVRRMASEAFGQDRVSVEQGAVQVLMNDGTEMKFYTVSQISDFLKQTDSEGSSGETRKNE